jgi:energy-coupling factor transport system ATP-binding protein
LKLNVKEITYRYGKGQSPILQDFFAEFTHDKIWAITGPNGAGKTTLGKVIMGILKPEKGSVVISYEDETASLKNPSQIDLSTLSLAETGRKIGYVMQNPARQIFSVSVQEEMEYGLRNLGLDEDEIKRRSKDFLHYFDLVNYEDTFPQLLSQGEKQRLVLAAVLAMKPDWLLLDEPTASLDLKRRQMLGEYLQRIRRELNTGIILISHDRKFIERYGECEFMMEGQRDV